MIFSEYEGKAGDFSATQVRKMLSAEQVTDLEKAARSYDCYVGDPYRHDEFDGDEEYTELCEADDEMHKEQDMAEFFAKYQGSELFHEQLMMLVEDYR